MKNSSRVVLLLPVLFLLVCVHPDPWSLRAQTVGGTILGVIQDQQGAVVANVQVSARNLETAAVRTAVAETNGSYRIPGVPAGSYEVTAAGQGFKTEVRTGIVVTVGGDISVNFALTIGSISEKVEVKEEASQVDTASATLGGFVNSETIRELPLNGRDWLQLALLQPGVNFNTAQTQGNTNHATRGNGLAIDISGGRPTDNAFVIDGLTVNDYANAGPGSSLHVNLGVDAIREFSVLTTDYSAEYGRGSGGIVNAITKSGTNDIHGGAYYFIRNSALDARNFFDGANIPPFRRSQYGGSIGGPIKKNKTFFFFNYEGVTELQSLSSSFSTISANAHNGTICANTACSQTIQVAINPKVVPYLALFPVPNSTVNGNTGIFAFGAPMLGDERYAIIKIDHSFSSTTTLSASYTYDNTTSNVPDNYDLKIIDSPSFRQNGVLNLQHVFSPTLIDNTRIGVSRTFAAANFDRSPTNPALTDPALGFIPGDNVGTISISGVTGAFGGIGSGFTTQGRTVYGYTAPQVANDLFWNHGSQSIRIGFSLERIDYDVNAEDKPYGVWTFPSVQAFLAGTPSQFAADYPGTNSDRGLRMSLIAGYVQDDIRLRPNLTINVGVRYEMGTTVSEVNGKIANLRGLSDPATAAGGTYYNNPTIKNFAPRIGYAWDPFKDGKTSIRGGFAIFDIVPLPYLFVNRLTRTTPYYLAGTVSNPPAADFPSSGLSLLGQGTLAAAHVEYSPRPAYKAQWNESIQRQLTKTLALTVGYIGSVGVHLPVVSQDTDQVPSSLVTWNGSNLVFPVPAAGKPIQRINPNFGIIRSTDWRGHSSYDGLQTNLVQRPMKGLMYQIAYTWSKSIDDGSTTVSESENANTAGASYAFCDRCNRAVSDFNIPQNVVANFLYDLPVPEIAKTNAFARNFLGGWQIGGVYTVQSGAPFSLKIGNDQADTGNSQATGTNGGQKPNYINAPGCSPDAVTGSLSSYIMTQCFAYPAPGVLGNLGRNTLRMPLFRDFDFSIFKNQNLWGEKLKLQFRAEMFNILNNTNIQAQTLTIFNGTGQLQPDANFLSGAATVNTSRQIQFGLRILF